MATADYAVSERMEKSVVWQRIDNANSRKWLRTLRATDKVTTGLAHDQAVSRMAEVESFSNVTNTTASKVGDSPLWEVKYTITQEEWENLGRYIGGIYQGP
jgi:hypothetical protein